MTEKDEKELQACEDALAEAGLPPPNAIVDVGEKGDVIVKEKSASQKDWEKRLKDEPKPKKKKTDKTTKNFKKAIKQYLDGLAKEDPLFAENYKKENKNIEECCNYIVNTVKETGRIGFEDEEVFNMAIHYYDEDDVKGVDSSHSVKIVSNYKVELTDKEKAKARKEAIDKATSQAYQEVKARKTPKKNVPKVETKEELTLF